MTCPGVAALLIGDRDDPHVDAVLARLPARGTVVVNAANVAEVVERVTPGVTLLRDVGGVVCTVAGGGPTVAWLRRLAPSGWDDAAVLGSHEAAVLSSRLALIAAIMRDPAISWLTTVDAAFSAESKIVQYRAAQRLRIPVPATMVALNADELVEELGEPFVLKAMGPGAFRDHDGQHRVVYSRSVTRLDVAESNLREAPFLAQQQLRALQHLRIVTVRGNAWVAALDAGERPLDWREDPKAHDAFVPSLADVDVEPQAVALAEALGCGYTSQDWIVNESGPHFIDLNPGGQWLFLPEPIASSVSAALAEALRAGGNFA